MGPVAKAPSNDSTVAPGREMFHDVVPASLRREWSTAGYYPDRDLYRLFAEQAANRPDQVAVIDDDGSITYTELLAAARRVANVLVAQGVRRGDIVGVQLPNGRQVCALDIALAGIGAVSLPISVHYRDQDVRLLMGRSGAVAAVVRSEFEGHDFLSMFESLSTDLPAMKSLFVTEGCAGHATSLTSALEGCGEEFEPADLNPDEAARILVTSGTEAASKMVVYSHNAIGGPFAEVAGMLGPRPGWQALIMVPLTTAMGSIATFGVLAGQGGTLVVTKRFTPDRILALIAEHRTTHVVGVPTMFEMLLGHPQLQQTDVSSVEVVMAAGSPVPARMIEELRQRFGCAHVSMYGCSDGAFCGTDLAQDPQTAAVTVGRPNPAISLLRIVDPDGHDLAPGKIGEIWGRGPMSPMCYLNAPDLDRRYRTDDGWTKTGDLGMRDAEGNIQVRGRLKDLIIRGGFNVSPVEIEENLVTHPSIRLAACIGAPDQRLGERICAFLVLREGAEAPTVETLGQFLLGRGLAKNKLPERIEILPELPLNPAGKVLKRVLRARLTNGDDRTAEEQTWR